MPGLSGRWMPGWFGMAAAAAPPPPGVNGIVAPGCTGGEVVDLMGNAVVLPARGEGTRELVAFQRIIPCDLHTM